MPLCAGGSPSRLGKARLEDWASALCGVVEALGHPLKNSVLADLLSKELTIVSWKDFFVGLAGVERCA